MLASSLGQRVRRVENARILTFDRRGPALATTLDLEHGRIVALDAPDRGHARDGAVLDARGRTLLPGLIDCHQHTLMGGLSLLQLDLAAIRSRRAFEAAVTAHCGGLGRHEWLEGHGWSEENWPGDGEPDASWLDGCGDRPAVCWRSDRHACLVNRPLLAHLESERLLDDDPPGGQIVRDAAGAPTGLLREHAASRLIRPLVPPPTRERKRDALRAAQALLLGVGLTCVMSMETMEDVEEVLVPLRSEIVPRMLVTLLDPDWPEAHAFARRFRNDARLAVMGHKKFIDGTLGSRTARLLEPYADQPGNSGLLVVESETALRDWIGAVAASGLSPSMHAIGDAALRLALDAIDSLPPATCAAVQPRVEHAQTAHPADIARTRGRWISMQPLHKEDDARGAERRLGAARMDRFFPFRRFLDAGARLGFGSDWPIVSADPWRGVRSAVVGRSGDGRVVCADQNLAPLEALAAYTAGAAQLLGAERHDFTIGVLRPGALADLVLLHDDPTTIDWSEGVPRVAATVVGGIVLALNAP